MDAKLDMIQRSRLLNKATVPRSEGGYSDSIADSVDSDVGPLRMSDLGDGEYDDMISSVAGVCGGLHLLCMDMADAQRLSMKVTTKATTQKTLSPTPTRETARRRLSRGKENPPPSDSPL